MRDVEVEWQFDALDFRPVERWLAALSEIGSQRLPSQASPNPFPVHAQAVPRAAESLTDTYLDTSDWRVGRSGFVLRVRQRGGHSEVTIKGATAATQGLRWRLEVTEDLAASGLQALGTKGPVGWRLRALVGRRPLLPVLEVRTRRRPFDLVVSNEIVAEIALDETTILVGEDHEPVRLQRVEVEVEPDHVAALQDLVDLLRRQCGLQPAALTKFEAGLLAAGRQIPGPPDLGSVELGPNPSVGEIAFVGLRRNLAAMVAHEPGTRLGEDTEELHDMRVATRRLRASLTLFAAALPVRARHVRAELGWLADALGAVRDLDVQLERVDGWLAEVPAGDREALGDLRLLLERERAACRDALLSCLDSARYERLVGGFSTMLRQGPSRRSPSARAPAAAVAPDLVEARHRAATKAARRARRSGDPGDFHRTRIRVKRLRYALELVGELYDKQTARYVRHVIRLQDALGVMQDAQIAADQLHELAATKGSQLSPVTLFVMGGVAQHYREESDRRARKVPRLLRELRGPEWRKVASLMERRRLELGALYRWPGPVGVGGPERSPAAAGSAARRATSSGRALVPPPAIPAAMAEPESAAVARPSVLPAPPAASSSVRQTPPHTARVGTNGDTPEPEIR